jgi:hypothetical protein
MPDEPYRPSPQVSEASTELARLAAEGQRRILDASASQAAVERRVDEKKRERRLRTALGGHYGSPVRIASLALIAVGVLMWVGGLACAGDTFLVFPLGLLIIIGGFLVRVFAPPIATRRRVASEGTWASSLPFTMEGYFEALASPPSSECRLMIRLAWGDAAPAREAGAVQGVFGVIDTGAQVESEQDGTLSIRTGSISGRTGIRVNQMDVYRNTRLVAYVHDLVDKVLLPLHRSHALARVSLTRE